MTDFYTEVAVIGGGAAGMAAGYFSAKAGAKTVILEKNEKLGRKMYITGKGRCNLTNDATVQEFLNEVPRNPKFLYSALSFLSPQDTMKLVSDHGCP
ncbi:MAG: NAD(P)/FAD-dependent oxidoreductase, partial [Clostridia bacterium]|nr:NAD(P)/FAD-dependent oxidoreductase [Clostridia bacterium]